MSRDLFDTGNRLLCAGTVGGLAEATLGGLPGGGELGAIGGLVAAFVVAGIWMFRRFGQGNVPQSEFDEMSLAMTAPAPREPAGAELVDGDDAEPELEEAGV